MGQSGFDDGLIITGVSSLLLTVLLVIFVTFVSMWIVQCIETC